MILTRIKNYYSLSSAPEFTGGETIILSISDGTDESKGVLYVTVEENSIPMANEMSESAIEDTSKDMVICL